MTDKQIMEAIRHIRPPCKSMLPLLIQAYRLGWQARGRRDQEVCRSHQFVTGKHGSYNLACEHCALSIARADQGEE